MEGRGSAAALRASFKAGIERYAKELRGVELEDLYVESASEHSPYTNNNYVEYKIVVKAPGSEEWTVQRRYR